MTIFIFSFRMAQDYGRESLFFLLSTQSHTEPASVQTKTDQNRNVEGTQWLKNMGNSNFDTSSSLGHGRFSLRKGFSGRVRV